MSTFYHEGSRDLQDRFDTRRLADRIEQRLVADRIGDEDKAFIESLDMFFLATSDAEHQPSCSYKGGEPGFVRVVD
ncbi:MAG TPA: pyridoxamine 5'-phosphate oxidase family protein, partial [Casimicrobiaceae bacterium]|nr:pyridoxamine 5'-phosphate oxidase family protein [Casimicrobiaceae bacterium]